MNDQEFMHLAIEVARETEKQGGLPIGAIIVNQANILAKGHSMVWPFKDPSSHGEINCMKAACKRLDTLDLSDCTLYTTLEPCSMCVACAGWSSLGRLVFGAYQEDVPGNLYELSEYHAEDLAPRLVPMLGHKVTITGGILRKECAGLMREITNWTPKLQSSLSDPNLSSFKLMTENKLLVSDKFL